MVFDRFFCLRLFSTLAVYGIALIPAYGEVKDVDVRMGPGLYTHEDFAAIRSQGIKVIVSVDGAKPNVELAEKYGMEYVHIHIGYDAVEPAQIAQLVKVMKEREFWLQRHQSSHTKFYQHLFLWSRVSVTSGTVA